MAPISNCLAFFCLVLSTTALTIPHFSHNVFNRHRAIAHVGVEAAVPVAAPVTPKLARSLNKRCVPKPSGNSTSSVYSSSAAPTSSVIAPVNVAPSPVLPTSSSSSSLSSPSPSSSSSSTSIQETSPVYSTPSPTPTPTPTTTYSSSSSSPAQTSSASSSGAISGGASYLTGTQSGQGTFYETGLGACGITNTDSDYIAAVSELLFDSYPNYNGVNPNDNPVCNKKVTASYGGKSVTVAITDRCTGCQITDLDFSPSAFSALADESLGRIDITWVWS